MHGSENKIKTISHMFNKYFHQEKTMMDPNLKKGVRSKSQELQGLTCH